MTRSRTPPAFYRSPLTRWSFILTGTYIAYALSPWGPRPWGDTPSLRFITQAIPLWLISALFAVYVLLLVTNVLQLVIIADALGLGLYAVGLVALAVTVRFDRPTNPLAVSAVALAVILHYAATRLAIIQAFLELAEDDQESA